MKLDLLNQLKQKLSQEKELSSIWSFYMDNFADYQEFTNLGEPTENPLLEAAVTQICQQMYGRQVAVRDLLLIRLADYKFVHGPFIIGGRIGGVIYFEEKQMGLVVVAELPPSQEVKYSRFSCQIMGKSRQSWLN
jgi:hypothetical protein